MKPLATLTLAAEVTRSGSIRKTAERLPITLSALPREILDFAAELGAVLFERTAHDLPSMEVVLITSATFVDRIGCGLQWRADAAGVPSVLRTGA